MKLLYNCSSVIFPILFLLLYQNAKAQVKADSIVFKVVSHGQISIEYIFENLPEEKYDIELICKKDFDITFIWKPQDLAGDLGKIETIIGWKKIRWNMTETEKDTLQKIDAGDFYFEVTATPEKSWLATIPWYYFGSAGLLAGSAALYFIIKEDDVPKRLPIGAPPIRP